MQAVARWIWVPVIICGIIALIVGIALIAGAAGLNGQVMDAVKDESLPVLTYAGGELTPHPDNLIDTPSEISDSAEAIKDWRWNVGKAYPLVTPPGEVNPAVSQNWFNFLTAESVLNSATTGLALGQVVNFSGIALLFAGIALILCGIVMNKVVGGLGQIGEALTKMAPPTE